MESESRLCPLSDAMDLSVKTVDVERFITSFLSGGALPVPQWSDSAYSHAGCQEDNF